MATDTLVYPKFGGKVVGNAIKIVVLAEFIDAKINYPDDFCFGTDNKTEEFLHDNPFGKVPLMRTADGPLYESNCICRYLVRKSAKVAEIYGANAFEQSRVDIWLDVQQQIGTAIAQWLYPAYGFMPLDEEKAQKAKDETSVWLKGVDSHLEGKQYLEFERVTLADIVLAGSLQMAFAGIFCSIYRARFPHLTAWYIRVASLPQFVKVVGPLALKDQLTLHCYQANGRAMGPAIKVMAVAQFAGVHVVYPSGFAMGTENKSPEYLAKFPFGKVPTLDTADGPLYESNCISRYLAAKSPKANELYGANPYEQSRVNIWLDIQLQFSGAVANWLYPVMGYFPKDEVKEAKAKEDVAIWLKGTNAHLEGKQFLEFDRLTLADIGLAGGLVLAFKIIFDPAYRAQYPHLTAWYTRIASLPDFVAITGPLALKE